MCKCINKISKAKDDKISQHPILSMLWRAATLIFLLRGALYMTLYTKQILQEDKRFTNK